MFAVIRRTPRGFRYERFGGIVQLERPRALVFVDRDRARRLGYRGVSRCGTTSPTDGAGTTRVLSAPLEAHLQLTNRCDAGCQGCYTGATPDGRGRRVGPRASGSAPIDELAARGVFHLALGGGESALLPWLGEVAQHARERGPGAQPDDLGLYGDAELERLASGRRCSARSTCRSTASARTTRACAASTASRAPIARSSRCARRPSTSASTAWSRATTSTGSARSSPTRKSRKLREVELLRFKPSGRGVTTYEELRCSDEQHRALAAHDARSWRASIACACGSTARTRRWSRTTSSSRS